MQVVEAGEGLSQLGDPPTKGRHAAKPLRMPQSELQRPRTLMPASCQEDPLAVNVVLAPNLTHGLANVVFNGGQQTIAHRVQSTADRSPFVTPQTRHSRRQIVPSAECGHQLKQFPIGRFFAVQPDN